MIGIDIVDIARIEKAASSRHFLERVFSPKEIEYFESKGRDFAGLAGFWCVKEAVGKALGTGVRFALTDVEVTHGESGEPKVRLHGKAAALLKERKLEISITHTGSVAAAVAMISEGRI